MGPTRTGVRVRRPQPARNHERSQRSRPAAVLRPCHKRTMEIVVALLLLTAGAVVIGDSMRLGFGWEADVPEPGYFPFYIALAMMGASLLNLTVRSLGAAAPGSPLLGPPHLSKSLPSWCPC